MCAKITFLAVVPESSKSNVIYKAFFFCKKRQLLIAIPVNWEVVDFLIRKNQVGYENRDRILNRFLQNKGGKLSSIELSKELEIYESIFKIKTFLWRKRIHTSFFQGFAVASLYKVPLEIKGSTLLKEGMAITKEMLNQVLSSFSDESSPKANAEN